jgi:hypothetical protein
MGTIARRFEMDILEDWCPKEDSNLHSLARTAT